MKDKQTKNKFSSYKNGAASVLGEIVEYFIKDIRFYSSMAKVLSVDAADKTATVQIVDGEELEGVRLQQVANDTGLFITPSVGSTVLVSWSDNTTAFIDLYSQIDSIIFQNGVNGGLIKINDLVTKINTIESDLNTLKTAFSAWVPLATDGGLALKTIAATWAGSQLTPTVNADLENENFKH